jgi:hypothetical protein
MPACACQEKFSKKKSYSALFNLVRGTLAEYHSSGGLPLADHLALLFTARGEDSIGQAIRKAV